MCPAIACMVERLIQAVPKRQYVEAARAGVVAGLVGCAALEPWARLVDLRSSLDPAPLSAFVHSDLETSPNRSQTTGPRWLTRPRSFRDGIPSSNEMLQAFILVRWKRGVDLQDRG